MDLGSGRLEKLEEEKFIFNMLNQNFFKFYLLYAFIFFPFWFSFNNEYGKLLPIFH